AAGGGVDVPGGHAGGGERARRGGQGPAPVGAVVGDQQVARAVHRHAVGTVESGADRGAAVTVEPHDAVAGHGVDVPGGHRRAVELTRAGRHHPDPVAAVVGDHQIARAVHGQPVGNGELGTGGRAAVR